MNSSNSINNNPQLDEHLAEFISAVNNSILNHNRNICDSFKKLVSLKSVSDTQLDHLLAINHNDVKRFSVGKHSSNKSIRVFLN